MNRTGLNRPMIKSFYAHNAQSPVAPCQGIATLCFHSKPFRPCNMGQVLQFLFIIKMLISQLPECIAIIPGRHEGVGMFVV
ncbi:MAG: hypothetical protein WAU91_03420 [Desulfatitalea sp.]